MCSLLAVRCYVYACTFIVFHFHCRVTTESLYTEVIYDIVHSKVEHVITPKPSYDSITGSLHDLIELRDLYKKALEDEMAIIERLGTRIDRNR